MEFNAIRFLNFTTGEVVETSMEKIDKIIEYARKNWSIEDTLMYQFLLVEGDEVVRSYELKNLDTIKEVM